MVDHFNGGDLGWFERDVASFDADEAKPWPAHTQRGGLRTGLCVTTRQTRLAKQRVPFKPPRVIMQQIEDLRGRHGHLLMDGCGWHGGGKVGLCRARSFLLTPENLQQRTMVELSELKPAKVQAQQADADTGEQAADVRPVGDVVTA